MDNITVIAVVKRGGDVEGGYKGRYIVMEGDLTSGGEHIIQCRDDML